MESADGEDIDCAEGDLVDVPAGGAVHSQKFTMSGDSDEEEEEEESAAPAAAAESGGDGTGPPAAGAAVDA